VDKGAVSGSVTLRVPASTTPAHIDGATPPILAILSILPITFSPVGSESPR
tara:strand:- start:604 stop:756 length:153 start_codon:yes stop_codon:yes gene_type:complete